MIDQATAVLKAQPFSMLLGCELLEFDSGRAVLRLPASPWLRQQHGFIHGGALAYLADNAMTFAAGAVLGNVVTAEIKVNYLRPAAGEGDLVAEACVLGAGKSQAVCRCEIYLDNGAERILCAAGQGTIRKVDLR